MVKGKIHKIILAKFNIATQNEKRSELSDCPWGGGATS